MDITEVKIFLKEGQDKKLKAYATLTFDNCFVVRNVKVIEGTKGMFVAMPSRKIKDPCPKCGFRNAIRSKFCNQCGATLPNPEPKVFQPGEDADRQSEHKDIAHPISAECRDYIQKTVLEAYENEKNSSPSPARLTEGVASVGQVSVGHSAPLRTPAPRSTEEDNDIEL